MVYKKQRTIHFRSLPQEFYERHVTKNNERIFSQRD